MPSSKRYGIPHAVAALVLSTTACPATGAGPDHWAFRPLDDKTPPTLEGDNWSWTDIDRFILARQRERGLEPVPDVSPLTLLRRLSHNLTGLPPGPQDIARIAALPAGDLRHVASEIAGRLLASPTYGEHWGRHWLDVVRYADTSGCSSDYPVPDAYRYRDYVIASFNRDKPFDTFVHEQVAGDLLPHYSLASHKQKTIATGYLAISRRFGTSGKEDWHTIEDTIDNLGKTFLGLNIACARCHDHTHDPISMGDYYALYGIFESTHYPHPGSEENRFPGGLLPLGSTTGTGAVVAGLENIAREAEALLAEVESTTVKKLEPDDLKAHLESIGARQKTLAHRRDKLLHHAAGIPAAYAVTDADKTGDTRLQEGGSPSSTGNTIPRGFLQVLGGQRLPENHQGSGRDHLARWLTEANPALTARVIANRVWGWHFNRGLVATANDFGTYGTPPTHSGLLDHLAARLIRDGWSIKKLQRRILSSHVYHLAGQASPKATAIDPDNLYLTHFPQRPLTAEEIADAVLSASGTLDRTPGDRHPFPPRYSLHYTQHSPFSAHYASDHRAVYWMRPRIQKHPILDVFDGADPNMSTGNRGQSTTPLQSLYLLNAPFIHSKSGALADLLLKIPGNDSTHLQTAHQRILGRPATPAEIGRGLSYLAALRSALVQGGVGGSDISRGALASYTRTLFCSNAFLHID